MSNQPLLTKSKIISSHASSQAPIHLSSFFTYVAFDITGEVTFSRPFGFLDQGADVGHGIAANVGLQIFLCTVGFYPGLAYLLNNPFMTWLGVLPIGHIVHTAVAALAERQKNPDARFDMAAHWFRGVEKARKDGYAGFNERHILAAAVSNLGAGSGESLVVPGISWRHPPPSFYPSIPANSGTD